MPYSRRGSRIRLLPLVLPIAALFTAGALATIVQSFGYMIPLEGIKRGTDAWMYLFSDKWIWQSAFYSLGVASSSAAVSVFLGTLLAWAIHRLPPGMKSAAMIYKIPLILPHLTIGYIAILLFSQSGIISSLTARLGLIRSTGEFPNLLYGGNGLGISLAYVMKETSFAVLMASGLLHKLDDSLIHSARMLGASRPAIFRDIVIPHLKPAILSSFLILSLYALGAFEIPWLIGESRPQMIGVTAFNHYFHRDLSKRPEAAALLSMLMLLTAVLIFLSFVLARRQKNNE